MGQQSHSATNTKLNRIAWLSKQDSKKEFECLMHLFNKESLIECFHELDKNKAVGIDGITKMAYGANLDGNIETADHQNEEHGLPTRTGKRSTHTKGRETGGHKTIRD